MTDTDHFHDELDRLDTGLAEGPDLASIRAAGGRLRTRRRVGAGVAAGACAAVIAVPLLAVTGGGAGDPVAPDAPVAAAPAAPADPSSADASFGDGMGAAVAGSFPGADLSGEQLGDRWVWRDHVNLDYETGSPIRWETLFIWAQQYDVDGTTVQVVSRREAPGPAGTAGDYCDPGLFVVERDCNTTEVGGRTVVVHDGTRARGQRSDAWQRTIDVYTANGTDSMVALTSVSVVGSGDTWADAQGELPGLDQLTALALDARLVLPEPDRYPQEFPGNRPQA